MSTTTTHDTDHHLKARIVEELLWAPNVRADNIGVAVCDAAVTLSGQVGTYSEKESARRAVLRLRGVTALADEITVRHPSGLRDDADVARDASTAIDRCVNVPAGSVKAAVHEHVITLSGTVTWNYEREAARRAVQSLRGVSGVLNAIVIRPPVTVSAADTKAQIIAAIVRNAQVDSDNVRVSAVGSEVTLTGTVSSWAERSQAEHAAWSSPGVTHVNNHLGVHL